MRAHASGNAIPRPTFAWFVENELRHAGHFNHHVECRHGLTGVAGTARAPTICPLVSRLGGRRVRSRAHLGHVAVLAESLTRRTRYWRRRAASAARISIAT